MSREMKDSGVEWIGEIPEDWDIERCKYNFVYHKDIAGMDSINYERLALTMRGVIKRAKEDTDGLQPESFDGYQIANEGDLIFKLIDLAGKSTSRVGLSPYTGLVSPAYILLHANDKKMSKEYAQYFFLSMWYRLIFNQIGNGGIRSSLNATDLLEVPITTPKLTEQTQIVHFLDRKCTAIDTAIEKTKKSIEKLEEYKKAVITKAVTKGIDSNAKMKDSGVEWIGEIPENWDVIKLKYLLKDSMKYGATETGIEYSEELPRYIRITDITPDNKLKDSGKLSLTEQQAEKYLLKEDTILFARSGATVGKTFLYKTEYGRAAFAGYMISAIPNNDKLLATWLYYYTLSFSYEDWVNRSFLQATIQNIGADKYSNLLISLPCINKQSEIVKYLDGKCAMFDAAIKKKRLYSKSSG